jgi:hypothetical protein
MAPVGASGKSPGSGDIIPWALQAENPNANVSPVPLTQAKVDAGNFDVIIAHAVAYSGEVPAMKAVNPKLKVLMYMNATLGQNATSGPGPVTDYAQCPGQAHAFSPTSTWYETDMHGAFVTNKSTGNCLMIPTNPLWIANRVAMCQTEAKAAGYDGCYLDDLGLGPLRAGYLSAPPVNPATPGKNWQPTAWLTATANLAKGVHSKVSPKLMMYGNGLTDGPSYYVQKTSQLVPAIDGGIAEGWLRQATGKYPTAAAWLQNVNMIGAVEKAGKPLLTLTKCWNCTGTGTSSATSWMQYSLASFLLGTGGKSMFFFSPSSSVSRTTSFSLYSTGLGTPSGAMAASGAAYTRKFASGIVVVNPSTASVVVSLGGTYFTVPGGCANATTKTSETSLTMAQDTACILTKT